MLVCWRKQSVLQELCILFAQRLFQSLFCNGYNVTEFLIISVTQMYTKNEF